MEQTKTEEVKTTGKVATLKSGGWPRLLARDSASDLTR
jgi:hypothetical protein